MRSEGFSFYIWGSGGWPVFAWPCNWRQQPSATVRNRLQPFATVLNRPQPSSTVRLRPSWAQSCRVYGKSRKNVSFSTCQKLWSCRFAWQAWHFVASATFSEDVLHFSWQAQHFGHLRCHFPWQAQHFGRVALRVFCESQYVSAARSGDKVQIPWQAWHLVTCHEIRRKPRTKRRILQ